ncbi:3-oxoacyl-[acyl-carrier-protein] synthase-3 [Actinokineospora baliensis]|uniref:3-oxoacyl-ACP synthase III family protein n=1 Tax=Actinokineospora baliensis TaxID=547056 RepID=UPI00195EEB09|nr:3-oxoacyl-[acyl-carrier-protein] synthase III C-terminal domain-containing protein [Actinokineospora baliensis]MBM7771677.1 3-oxoacyl-[acyl-carrier-protein] synthase-3 [Actinokineospora baliensis]
MPHDFGIVGLGTSLGEPRDVPTAARRAGLNPALVATMGFRTYHQAPAGVLTTDLAVAAARAALTKAGVPAADVDHIVVASGAVPEYHDWDLSAAVARDLGTPEVPTLVLTQSCLSAVHAFQYIAGQFAIRAELRTVLLVSTERNAAEHAHRLGNGTTAISDGAVAAVLRRDHPGLRWLATEQITDARYADFFRLEYGGNARPTAPPGRDNRSIDPAHAIFRHFDGDAARFSEYAKSTDARVADVVDLACERVGLARADLAKVILLNANQVAMGKYAEVLGIPLTKTNADLASVLGHFGGMDPLVALDIYTGNGTLTPGDVVALAGMSSGLHWFCTLLRV